MSEKLQVKVINTGKYGGPILARFPSGVPPLAETDLQVFGKEKPSASHVNHRRLVAAVNDKCAYVGDNFSYSGRAPCSYAVAIYDQASKTLTMHPVQNPFTMNVVVERSEKVAANSLVDMPSRNKRQLLINSFGSRKRRRDQKAREASRINSDNITGGKAVQALLARTALNEGVSSNMGTNQERAVAENRKNFLPPFDANATEQQNVYKADDLLLDKRSLSVRTRHFVNLIQDNVALIEAQKEARKNHLTNFIVNIIQNIQSDDLNQAEQKKKAQLLAVLSYLRKFYRLPHRFVGENLGALAKKYFFPAGLMKKFCERFGTMDDLAVKLTGQTQDAKIRVFRNDQQKDKLIVWIFAVSLLLSEKFTCSTKDQAAEMELPAAKVTQYFRLLGCTVKSGQARMNAPPIFPRRSRGRPK